MNLNQSELYKNRINNIINLVKNYILFSLPKKSLSSFSYLTESYFVLAFLDNKNLSKSKKYVEQGFHPLPFLIKPNSIDAKSIVNIDKSQYGNFTNTKFLNGYSFSLGKDSSFILYNHTVSVESKELGKVEYTLDLAYIIYFGDNITKINFYNYLENLIFYSIDLLRS